MRYVALRTIATVFKVLAWIVAVAGFILGIVGAVAAEGPAAAVVTILAIWIGAAIYALLLFAFSQFIYLFLDIEQNTRDTAERLKQRD